VQGAGSGNAVGLQRLCAGLQRITVMPHTWVVPAVLLQRPMPHPAQPECPHPPALPHPAASPEHQDVVGGHEELAA
jgi:hypothetical protein